VRPARQGGGGSDNLLTVQRGLQVLRAFGCQRAALSNAELVRRTGLPKATVSRLTTTLVQLGYLRHAPGSARFELGDASLTIGDTYRSTSELLRIADSVLQELADHLDLSVALAMADAMDMLYVGYRIGQRVTTLRMGVGSLIPMGTTASGRAYLWAVPVERRAALLDEVLAGAGDHAGHLQADIRTSFAELDATGSCLVHSVYQRDVCAIARPVRVGPDGMVMTLSCGRIAVAGELDLERRRVGPPLAEAAARLQALLASYDGFLRMPAGLAR